MRESTTVSRRTGRRGDRGIVLILFAISITAMLAVAALVLGSGLGYTAARNAQNATDAAAAAASAKLEDVRRGDADAAEVLATAVSVAEDNGATGGTVVCELVAASYGVDRSSANVLGPCSQAGVLSERAAGVRITAHDSRHVPFSIAAGQEMITARAVATATIQPIRSGRITSPFLVCAVAPGHGVPLLLDDPTAELPWTVNPAAVGHQIQIWANGNEMRDGGRSCGAANWHGVADTESAYAIPSTDRDDPSSWWPIESGSRVGHVPEMLAGPDACDGRIEVGCELLLPLCSEGRGHGIGFRMYCPRMAAFEVTFTGEGPSPCNSPRHAICARMTEGGVPIGGRGTADDAMVGEPTRVKLVE